MNRPLQDLRTQPVRGPLNSRLFSPSPIQVGGKEIEMTPAKAMTPKFAGTPAHLGLQSRNPASTLARKLQLTPFKDITTALANGEVAATFGFQDDCIAKQHGTAVMCPAGATDASAGVQAVLSPDDCFQSDVGIPTKKSTSKMPSNTVAVRDVQTASPPGQGDVYVKPHAETAKCSQQQSPDWDEKPSQRVLRSQTMELQDPLIPGSTIEATPSELGCHTVQGGLQKVEEPERSHTTALSDLSGGITFAVSVEDELLQRRGVGQTEECATCCPILQGSPHADSEVQHKRRAQTRSQTRCRESDPEKLKEVAKTTEKPLLCTQKMATLPAEHLSGTVLSFSLGPESTACLAECNPQRTNTMADATARTCLRTPSNMQQALDSQDQAAQAGEWPCVSPVEPSPATDSAMEQAFRQVESMIPLPCDGCSDVLFTPTHLAFDAKAHCKASVHAVDVEGCATRQPLFSSFSDAGVSPTGSLQSARESDEGFEVSVCGQRGWTCSGLQGIITELWLVASTSDVLPPVHSSWVPSVSVILLWLRRLSKNVYDNDE